ncbi:MAG: hypothetical protein QM795_05555 [Pseudoxanthomonas sp.]
MGIQTGWLAPPAAIGGIDHLGTQTPCQLVYAQLVPGITNVTDRARYYSLYPWVIWSYEQRFKGTESAHFVQHFRRADFLLTLVAEHHARGLNEPDFLHGAAMAGRSQLANATKQLQETGVIDLDTFATREEVPSRYFKQTLGGLGQYYVGTLTELSLLNTEKRDWVRYTATLGLPLAEAVEEIVPSDLFWKVVASGSVLATDLNALAAFCPCGLRAGTQEYRLLEELFFSEGAYYATAEGGRQRRLSLALLLHLAESLSTIDDANFDVMAFRGAIYSGYLPDGQQWQVPSTLQATRECWHIYQSNELLSVAFLSLFASTLDLLAERQKAGDIAFPTIEALASHVSTGVFGDALEAACKTPSFGEYLDRLAEAAPSVGDWTHEAHEHQLGNHLVGSAREGHESEALVVQAFRVIALLAIRVDESRSAYDGILLAQDDLQRYPINLESFRARLSTWRKASVREVLQDITHWCLATHLSVALRKLRETSRSTFRFRLGERGIEIVDVTPLPTRTTPRFNQSTQILIDMGALCPGGSERHSDVMVTNIGRHWMERHAH